MKKTLSLILAALMLLTMAFAAVPAYAKEEAAEPQAVSTAAEFAAMEAKGSYYLTADIDLTGTDTYVATFSGVLDGKGHKLTVNKPVFENLAGTVSNLELAGTVAFTADRGGVLANNSGNVTLTNVINRATVNGSKTQVESSDALKLGGVYGGLIGSTNKESTLVLNNCVNYGTITGYQAGGLLGKSHSDTTLNGCKNYGNIVSTDAGSGLVAWQWGNFKYIDCANGDAANAPRISAETDGDSGMVGYVSGSTDGSFINCVNYGEIVNTESPAGGICGRAGAKDGLTFTNCVNYGKISGSKAGGICGQNGGYATITGCVNYGETVGTKQAAGIICSLGDSDTSGSTTIEKCTNFGKVTATADTAAGIIAYANGSSSRVLSVISCVNTADVAGGCEASGILGYINGCADIKVKYCVNTGMVSTTDASQTALGIWYSKVAVTEGNIVGNVCIEGCATKEYRNGSDYIDMTNTRTKSDLESGKVCYELNTAIGAETFYQTLGTDKAPVTLDTHKKVIKEGETYKNPADPQPPVTGDALTDVAVVAAVALVSLFGMAYTAKRYN